LSQFASEAIERYSFRAVSPRETQRRVAYGDEPFAKSFGAFTAGREALFIRLERLPARPGTGSRSSPARRTEPASDRPLLRDWLAAQERVHVKHIGAAGALIGGSGERRAGG
jgi:hypothetical protein